MMKLTRGAIPLYYQIAQILRSQIQSREYKPEDLLPTEEELIRTMGVSRTTVRQALQMLFHEGLIYRIPGKGTFVAVESTAGRGDWAVESVEGIVSAGYAGKMRFLSTRTIRAGKGLSASFGIPAGSELTEFRKIQFVDDEPLFDITLHVLPDLAAKIPETRIEEKPVFVLLEEYADVRIREVHQWTAAALAGTEVAQHLRIRPGDPVLLVERHFIDEAGQVVEIATDHYRTDRRRHFLRLTRPGSGRAGQPHASAEGGRP